MEGENSEERLCLVMDNLYKSELHRSIMKRFILMVEIQASTNNSSMLDHSNC